MRLHESLLESCIDSKILVLDKESDNKDVIKISRNRFLKKMSHFFDRIPTFNLLDGIQKHTNASQIIISHNIPPSTILGRHTNPLKIFEFP